MSGSPEHHESLPVDVESDSQSTSQFDAMYAPFVAGEFTRSNEDGSHSVIRAYELTIDPQDRSERRGIMVEFALRAAQAGYHQAFGSVAIPDVGFRDAEGRHPLTAVYFFLQGTSKSNR